MTEADDAQLPLSGTIVLDLTGAWAGPMATRFLAVLGATVIKIEAPGRMDTWRETLKGVNLTRYLDLDHGEQPFNRAFRFHSQNHDKLSLVLDLKSAEGKQAFLKLVPRASMVINNFSPGTMNRLGLGYDALREVNPEIAYVDMPAYGNKGPDALAVAYGPNMEAMSGAVNMQRSLSGLPQVTSGAYLDPINGMFGAAAALKALLQARHEKRSVHVEVAQREADLLLIGDLILRQIMTDTEWHQNGNAAVDWLFSGALPACGDDEWLAVSIQSSVELRIVGELLSVDADSADRIGAATEVFDLLSPHSRRWDKHDLAARLQAQGIPAAPVLNGAEVAEDPHFSDSGIFQDLHLAVGGIRRMPGVPLGVQGLRTSLRVPAPDFGAHNRPVLRDVAGMTDEEIDKLYESGSTADEPR